MGGVGMAGLLACCVTRVQGVAAGGAGHLAARTVLATCISTNAGKARHSAATVLAM